MTYGNLPLEQMVGCLPLVQKAGVVDLPLDGADGNEEAPFAIEGSQPRGRFMVRGDRNDAVGPSLEGGR
jgi:hypothetical protein